MKLTKVQKAVLREIVTKYKDGWVDPYDLRHITKRPHDVCFNLRNKKLLTLRYSRETKNFIYCIKVKPDDRVLWDDIFKRHSL